MTGALVGGGVLILLLVLDRMANKVLIPTPRPIERTVLDTGLEHEDFEIPSGDHRLAAYLLHPSQSPKRPLILFGHGWGANHSIPLGLAEGLVEAGYEVLLFDTRGHGGNPPVGYVTIRHFRDDMMSAARYARERFPDRPLVLMGHSLGGSAAVLATVEGAPSDGIVSIAAPSDVIKVTAEFLVDQGLPGHAMVAVLRPFWWPRAGSLFGPLTPSRRISEVSVPLLMIQPEHDRRVPRWHADALADGAGQPYQLIPDTEHTNVLAAPETLRLIEDFLAAYSDAE